MNALDYLLAPGPEILPGGTEELSQRLATADKPLRIKLGIDPTTSELHLGHTVCLQMLARFQELGHLPVVVIGGFTAQLGDPSGRNEARPPLTAEQVSENSYGYLEQVGKILDMDRSEVVNNADWLDSLSLKDVLKLSARTTVNKMIAKEAFGNRLDNGYPLYVSELMYPILQAYDSVMVRADVELGGTDQRFNVLMGRDLQKDFGQQPQVAMLLPLLVGLDGHKKMSKTEANHIALAASPEDMYGKTMSLPDRMLGEWIALTAPDLTTFSETSNPRDLKMKLAHRLVEMYHSRLEADRAQSNFVATYQKRELPENMPEYHFNEGEGLVEIMVGAGLVASRGEAKRLVADRGVRINGEKASLDTSVQSGDVLQVGKRKFVRVQKP